MDPSLTYAVMPKLLHHVEFDVSNNFSYFLKWDVKCDAHEMLLVSVVEKNYV